MLVRCWLRWIWRAEGSEEFAGGDVPEFDGVVGAAGDEGVAVPGEANGSDGVGVARQSAESLAGRYVPEADGAVDACGGERVAVGGEGKGIDDVGVAG